MRHFNIEVKGEGVLTRENYLDHIEFNSDEERQEYLLMFDKHCKYFNDLSQEEFELQIEQLLNKFKGFKKINDLTNCEVAGVYILVLDQYKQMYVGISNNIRKRIIQHWNRKVKKDYLSTNINKVPIGIDCFKANDTTRIYIWEQDYSNLIKIINMIACHNNESLFQNRNYYYFLEEDEAKIVKFIDNKFLCNRYIRIKSKSIKRDLSNY